MPNFWDAGDAGLRLVFILASGVGAPDPSR